MAMIYLRTFYILSILLIIKTKPIIAQDLDPREIDEHFKYKNYLAAIKSLEKFLKKEPNNPDYNYKMGFCYLNTNIDKAAAIPYLEKANKFGKVTPEMVLDLGRAYQHGLKFDDAIKTYTKYKSMVGDKEKAEADRYIEQCNLGKEMVKYPLDVTFENLGPSINSEYPDYYPFVPPDESFFVFTSRRKGGASVLEYDGYYSSDIFISYESNGQFEKAKNIGPQINTGLDEEVVGISVDGNKIFIYIDHIKEVGEIYLSERKGKNFGARVKLGKAVNSEGLETSATMSADGNILYFASNRPGGLGGTDIWMTKKLPNGEWAEPQNLGPTINTPYNEDFPNMLPDGKTLYFASQGHKGLGGYDIFSSIYDEEKNTWTKPKNIGYPINNPADNMTIFFSQNMKYAYISDLRKGGLGDLDIYRVNFNNRDDRQTVVKCVVSSTDVTKNVNDASVSLIELSSQDEIGIYTPNSKNKFVMAIPPGKYQVVITAAGFNTFKEEITILGKSSFQETIEKEFKLSPK
jgi:tetratricopeptide (TPR) repeat protein